MQKPFDPSERQDQMVDDQIVSRGVRDPRVIEAMKWVPRERFFPKDLRSHAFDDAAAPIGHGQTISQPYIVALMTESLAVEPTHKILEIGTGSGYQTAILAKLASEVYTVERVKTLLDAAFERLATIHVRNVHFHFGDGCLGWAKHAPYDRILVTAGAPDIPHALAEQLSEGGIIVAPVGGHDEQSLVRYVKRDGILEHKTMCGVRFVPLIGEGGWSQ